MSQPARWIRLDRDAVLAMPAACRGFARLLGPRDAPVCLWGRPESPARLDDGLWGGPGEFAFALLVPSLHAPGRRDRWVSWGLSPVVAALRRFGVQAYLDGSTIRLHGERIGGGTAQEINGCAAVYGAFPADAPAPDGGNAGRGKLLEFDPWLSALNREGRALRTLAAFRSALEVQHGWQFDTGWPSEAEQGAIASVTSDDNEALKVVL